MIRAVLTGVVILGVAIAPLHADDTEIFVTQAGDIPDSGRANVLFIIDTSGSMDAQVLTQAEWNPATQFDGCYRSDAVYFSTSPTAPPCDSEAYFEKTDNFCEASRGPLDQVGQFGGFLLAWDEERERWAPLAGGERDRPVECEADRGVHGDGTPGELFAADGNAGPWQPNAAQEPAWNAQFTVFDGNWLNWRSSPPSVSRSRLQIVQTVVNSVVDSLQGVNVGLMRFNPDEGGPVIHALEDIETARATMRDAVNSLTPAGFTPLSETLYEAGQYLRGADVDYGNAGPDVFSVAESRLGGSSASNTYLTPVTASCQKNFIVLLTDGEPAGDSTADGKIPALPGFAATVGPGCDGSGEGACLDDMAEYLFENDLNPTLPGEQNAITHTIGFTIDLALLASTAQRGGGQYSLADDTASLAAVLTGLVQDVTDQAATFTSAAVPVNVFNRAAALDDVFVSLFVPSDTARWPGNLKKYRFLDGQLVGQDGQPAVELASGFFSPTAWSFWSASRDGDRVTAGGAASRLPDHDERALYTNLSGTAQVDLTASANRVETANSGLTAALLGVAGQPERDALIEWARGRDVQDEDRDGDTAESRRAMGDPLHVRPVTVTYGGTVANPDIVIFLATNDGYLHAFNADDGTERWAFIPQRLLARLNELYVNAPTTARRYGLDGEIRLFIENDDGQPGFTGSGERAILLFGMGRGGDAVFALDITNKDQPQLLWEIDSDSTGLELLGQTWSTPVVARVNVGGTVRPVAVFGGGYDDGQDTSGFRAADAAGNALFMVDLDDGTRVWSAGPTCAVADCLALPAMQHSIPAPLRVADLSGDGLADRIYVGDMGGRLWRFDIVNGSAAGDLVAGGVFASLGGAANAPNPPDNEVRRFYATPDAVITVTNERVILAVNIGSGHRGHPLETEVNDAFFSVWDGDVFNARTTASYTVIPPIEVDDLTDITDNQEPVIPPDAAGWVLRLEQSPGEKVLSSSLTLDNIVFFASFSPTASADACVAGAGLNRAYQISLLNGAAVTNLDGSTDGELTIEDRFTQLSQTAITPPPTLLTDESGQQVVCIGLECFPLPDEGDGEGSSGPFRKTFWVQEQPE